MLCGTLYKRCVDTHVQTGNASESARDSSWPICRGWNRLCPMNAAYSPLVSEFESAEQEASYTAWLQAKVAASLADPRPAIPHDEVERRMAERLQRLRERAKREAS